MKKTMCRFGSDCTNPRCSLSHPNNKKRKTIQTKRPVQARPVQTPSVQTPSVQTPSVQTPSVQTQPRPWQRPNQSILAQVKAETSPSILAQVKAETGLAQIKASQSILAQVKAETSPSILEQVKDETKKGEPKKTNRPLWNTVAKRPSLMEEIAKANMDAAYEKASDFVDEIIYNKFDDVAILKEFIHNELNKWKTFTPVDYTKTEIPKGYWADMCENGRCFDALKSFVSGIYMIGTRGITLDSLKKTLEKEAF